MKQKCKNLSMRKFCKGKTIKTVCCSKFDPRDKVDRITNPVTDNDLDIWQMPLTVNVALCG